MRIFASCYHFFMGLLPETRNVLQLGASFFFIFLAFNSQGFIEEPVIESASRRGGNIDIHAGFTSQALIYGFFTFANFVAAPIVELISAKWAMALGGLCYCIFLAGFLFLNSAYLYITSCILGFGAAIIWTGQGTYLAKNCDERTTGRNSSLLWAMLQGSLIGGGLFLFVVFKTTGTTDDIADSTTKIMYGVFTGLAAVGIVVIALLPAPPAHLSANQPTVREDWKELIVKTFRLMFTKRMLIMALVFAYTGLMQSFWTGVYPTCISFTEKLGSDRQSIVAINAMLSGAGQCIAGLLFGILSSKTAALGRHMIIFLGTIVHVIALSLVFINFPHDANLGRTGQAIGIIQPSVVLAVLTGFLLGFGDACWNTQIYSHLVSNFSDKSAQAFALYKFYQSALSCAAFFYSSHLGVVWHLLIMLVCSLIAAAAFFVVEKLLPRIVSKRDEAKVEDDDFSRSDVASTARSEIHEVD